MPRPPIWYLQKIELFSGLTDEEIGELVTDMEHNECPAKQILYTPDMEIKDTYILKEGEVTLYQMKDGKRVVLDILKPGAIFGNIGIETNESSVYAEVSQRSFICTLPPNFFVQMLCKRPDVAVKAFKILNRQIAQYQSQLQFLSVLSARDRVLATIKLINDKDDQSILPSILRMPTKITHEKLASMTGLTRETVTKQLHELQNDQLITVHGKIIRVTPAGVNVLDKLK